MKIKITLTTLSVIIALAFTGFSQNKFSGPQNMGAILNTTAMDQLPVIAPNGLSLYFGSNRTGGQGEQDIWVSQRATLSSAWGAPQNLGTTINTSSNDTPSTFSADGREMFIQSTRPGGTGGVDIYISTRTDPNNDFGWTAPVNIGTVINTTTNDYFGNYFISPTTGAGTLFFNSNRTGGLGLNDIYQSSRNPDGTFNAPVAVTELNSALNEERTAISRDGLEFYLSSNRLVPTTNQVIFVSTRLTLSSPWSVPVPVAGLNTSSNAQPALSPDGLIIYFASNRPGTFGLGDLHSATRCSLYSASSCTVNRALTADFDGDGSTDVSVFRPSDGTWYVLESGSNTFRAQQFGLNGDKIVPGDYDGDSRIDLAVFRPSDRNWYVRRSSDNAVSITNWGLDTDRPVPGDYDGDGKSDIAVFRDGVWYIIQSSNGGFNYQYFGLSSDIPIAAANVQ